MTRAGRFLVCASMHVVALAATSAPSAPAYAEEPPAVAKASPPLTPASVRPAVTPALTLEGAPLDKTMFALEGDGNGNPATAPAVAPPTATPHVPTWRTTGSWGWLVVVTAVGLGVATTAYGLTLQCAEDDTKCRRETSLAIWGGVGIAAVGSTFGIVIVQMGQARVRAKPAVFAGDFRSNVEARVRPLVPGLILDAQF